MSYPYDGKPQGELRKLVNDLTTPVVPLKKLARIAGVSERTLWNFRAGYRCLNNANEGAVRMAVAQLVREVVTEE